MKKFIFLLVFVTGICDGVFAQDNKDKVKKTSTLPQKVHNTFSRHNHHKGYKTKYEHNGVIRKHKVEADRPQSTVHSPQSHHGRQPTLPF